MAQAVHAAPAGHTGPVEHRAHHPTARFYVGIFFVLLVVTILEVLVAQEPYKDWFAFLPGGVIAPLLILAAAKFFLIAAFYMHLKQDSRVFAAFFITGLTLAIGMWGTFGGLFLAHSREPFDQATWREEIASQSGTGAATGTPASGGH